MRLIFFAFFEKIVVPILTSGGYVGLSLSVLLAQHNQVMAVDIVQGFFNAGLCAMNFINGLHSRGIGSCCLQWSNNYTEDTYIRKLLNLRKSERIAVVIGAGYYLNHNIIPCSCRRSITDLLRVV